MDVEIKHLPIGSHSYVENHNCLFTISSFQNNRGFLTSPQHSLPDRTTCTYFLQGAPGEIVWISLLKFYIGPQHGKSTDDSSTGGSSYSSSMFSSGGGGSGSIGGGGSGRGGSAAGIISNSPDCNATYLQIWQGTYGKLISQIENFSANTSHHIHDTCEYYIHTTHYYISYITF